ncbi:unnamed protein product [Closterium sp. NIES-54]
MAIFDLDFDAILSAMYALSVSAEGDCYRCVPPDPGIAAAALGASECGTLPGTAPADVRGPLSEGLGFESRCMHFGPPSAGGCQRSTGDPGLILGKGYRHVGLGGYGRTEPLLKKPFYPNGLVVGILTAEALHTFTFDSSASCCFFCDSTTLTPLPAPVSVRQDDPSRGPVVARSSTVLPCPAVPSGSMSGLHLPSFSTNLVSTAALQDAMVTTTTSGGQRVSICTCTRTGRHLATFTCELGSSLYTLTTEPSQVAASAQVSASGQVAASCSCRLLSHLTLLWHHRLDHPSLPRLHGMHSRLLVSGLPRSLPPLPPSLAPPCLPCVEGRQRAAPHSSLFPPTTAPLQTLHMDIKGQVVDVLIPWICTVSLQLREQFGQHLLVLCLHSDRGSEFSSNLLRDFCRGEGILQSFMLPDSPQQSGIAERRIGLVMEVARTSMIHVAAPHFLWPFAVWYAAHQLNVRPCVSLPETSPTLRWTREVGDASVFRGPAPSGVSQVDPLPGLAPVQVAVDSGATRGAVSRGAERRGAESEGAETGGVELGGVDIGGAEPRMLLLGVVSLGGAESGGAELQGSASSGGSPGPRVAVGVGIIGGSTTAGPGGARTRGTGAAGPGGVEGARAGDLPVFGTPGAGGAGAGGGGVGGPGVGGAGAGKAGAVDPGGAVRPRPYFVPLLQQVLGTPPSTALSPPILCPPPDQSQPPLQPASPLPAPSRYTALSGGLSDHRDASRPISPVCTARRVPHSRPPPVPGMHAMTLSPSSISLRIPLPDPPESSLLESATAFARVAESASASPPSVGGECALGTDLLEDKQEEFESVAAVVPRFTSLLPAHEGDPDAPDIPTPRSYAEAITGPYSSHWQAAMDPQMASSKSTGTYVDEVPQPGANIVHGMWIFRVKRPPVSPPALKARYVARGFSQRHGVDYFQTSSPTPKMITLRVLLHVAAQRDYELHSLDFSTAFLQRSLHEEIWLRRPPGFVGVRA